ncbi:unnamed protein product [Brugia pahangi]|uniref:UBP-type domain-containing protein n=1 Tax=Brugia pahangi TaxID=6280 RepID=A0A0N4TDS6_BRUPA|nr:unnamed protein product [Brugia pahangi]
MESNTAMAERMSFSMGPILTKMKNGRSEFLKFGLCVDCKTRMCAADTCATDHSTDHSTDHLLTYSQS